MDYRDMSFFDAVKYMPTRLINVFNKVLGLKGIALTLTIWLFNNELIPNEARGYVWVLIILIVVFGEKTLEVIKDIKR